MGKEEDRQLMEVFKLQWPIIGDKVLCYNANRSFVAQFPQTPALGMAFYEHDKELNMKLYVNGYIDDNGNLCFDDEDVIPYKEWPEW